MKKTTIMMIATLMSVTSFAQTQIQVPKSPTVPQGYLEYKGCASNCPVIIFLHGAGERGNGTSELGKVAGVGIPKFLKSNPNDTIFKKFIVLSPQHSPNAQPYAWQWTGEVIPFIKWAVKTYPQIDTTRIFLTGLSMGDGWVIIAGSDNKPNYIRALATVSGAGKWPDGQKAANMNLPVYWIWGTNDETNTEHISMQPINGMASINNGHIEPKLWKIQNGAHNNSTWDPAYKSTSPIYNWMLSFKSLLPTDPLPIPNRIPIVKTEYDPTTGKIIFTDGKGIEY